MAEYQTSFHRPGSPCYISRHQQLLTITRSISSDPRWQYGPITLLVQTFAQPKQRDESIKYLHQAIYIAQLPNSFVAKDIPDLYMRIGVTRVLSGETELACKSFDQALKAEKDPNGFHASLVLFWWGNTLNTKGHIPEALQKLNIALSNTSALKPKERKTLLADILQLLASIDSRYGNGKQTESLVQRSQDEIRLQRQLHSEAYPDYYHRL